MVAIFASATALLTPEFVESFEPEKLASKFVKVEKEYGVKFNKTSATFNIVGHWESIQNAHKSLRKLMQIPSKAIFEGFNGFGGASENIKVELEGESLNIETYERINDGVEDAYTVELMPVEKELPVHRIKGNPKRGRYPVDPNKSSMVPDPVVYFQYQDKSFLNEDGVNIDAVLDEYEKTQSNKKVTKEELKKILEKNTEQMGRPLNKTLPRGATVPTRTIDDGVNLAKDEFTMSDSGIMASDAAFTSFTNTLVNSENISSYGQNSENNIPYLHPLTNSSFANTLTNSDSETRSPFQNTIESAWARVNNPALENFRSADIAGLMSMSNIVTSTSSMFTMANSSAETGMVTSADFLAMANSLNESNITTSVDMMVDTANNVLAKNNHLTPSNPTAANMLDTEETLMSLGQFTNLDTNSDVSTDGDEMADNAISFTQSLLHSQDPPTGSTIANTGAATVGEPVRINNTEPVTLDEAVSADVPVKGAPVPERFGEPVSACDSVIMVNPVTAGEQVPAHDSYTVCEPGAVTSGDVYCWAERQFSESRVIVKNDPDASEETFIDHVPVDSLSDGDEDVAEAYTEMESGYTGEGLPPGEDGIGGGGGESHVTDGNSDVSHIIDKEMGNCGTSLAPENLEKTEKKLEATVEESPTDERKQKSRRKSKPSKYIPTDDDNDNDKPDIKEKGKIAVKRKSKAEKLVSPLKIRKTKVSKTAQPAKKKVKETTKEPFTIQETMPSIEQNIGHEVENLHPGDLKSKPAEQKPKSTERRQKPAVRKQKTSVTKPKPVEHKITNAEGDSVEQKQTTSNMSKEKLSPVEKQKRKYEKRGEGKIYKCTECDYQGQRKKRLTEHMGRVHGLLTEHCRGSQEKTTFPCDECDKSFVFGKDLNRHKKIVHHGQSHFCTICQKSYKSKYVYDKHMTTHEAGYIQPMFACQICERQFTTKFSLGSHIKSEHLGLKKTYICPTCGKSFSQIRSYRQHANVHAGIRPYVCEICSKSFTYDKSLKEHRYMHDNIRRFPCSVCGKAFRQRTCLLIHMKVHRETKDHICSSCGKGFTQKQSLLRHERIHTGDKPYSCKLCHKSFSDYAVIRKHMLMSHKKDKNEWKLDIVAETKKTSDHYIAGGPGYVPRDTSTLIRGKNFATIIPPSMPGGPTTITDHGCGDPSLMQNAADISNEGLVITPHSPQDAENMFQKVVNIDDLSSESHVNDGGITLYHHLPSSMYANSSSLSMPFINNYSTSSERETVNAKSLGIDGARHIPVNYNLAQGGPVHSYSATSTPDHSIISDESMVANFFKQQARQSAADIFTTQIMAPLTAVDVPSADLPGQLVFTMPSAVSTATTSSGSLLNNPSAVTSLGAWGYAEYPAYYNTANFAQFQSPPQN